MRVLFILMTALVSISVSADPRVEWARKASLHLVGAEPEDAVYKAVRAMDPQAFSQFKSDFINVLQGSEAYQRKMITEITEHLGLPSASPRLFTPNDKLVSVRLMWPIVKDEAPWPSLFNSRSIQVDANSLHEIMFYKRIFKSELKEMMTNGDSSKPLVLTAKTEAQKNAMAGFITTPDFFSRYFATETNLNFKRAAALYRLIMCNDMKPVILSDAAMERGILELSMADLQGKLDQTVQPHTLEERHASEPGCRTCHNHLDGPAKLFSTSPKSPTGDSLRSSLFYGGENREVLGLGQWVDQALATETSKRCQVRFFWDLVVGRNVPLPEPALQELVGTYDQVGQSFNQMVRTMVLRSEFSATADELEQKPVTYSDVKAIFKRCDSCHESEPHIPEFGNKAKFGWSLIGNAHEEWLGKIAKETDVDGNGARAKMPPAKAGWKLSAMEYKLLRRWLSTGARDEKGEPTTQASFARAEKLGLAEASLLKTFKRVLSPRLISQQYLALEKRITHGGDWFCSTGNTPSSNSYDVNSDEINIGAYLFMKNSRPVNKPGSAYYATINRCFAWPLINRYNARTSLPPYELEAGSAPLREATKFIIRHVFGESRFSDVEQDRLAETMETRILKTGVKSLPDYSSILIRTLVQTPEYTTY